MDLRRFRRLFRAKRFVLKGGFLGEGVSCPGSRRSHRCYSLFLLLLLLLLVVAGSSRVNRRFVARVGRSCNTEEREDGDGRSQLLQQRVGGVRNSGLEAAPKIFIPSQTDDCASSSEKYRNQQMERLKSRTSKSKRRNQSGEGALRRAGERGSPE